MLQMFQKNKNDKIVAMKPKYEFIDQYILADPKNVLINYSAFNMCGKIPVACETVESKTSTFKNCVHLPNQPEFTDYLTSLTTADKKLIKNPLYRTIYVVNLAQKKQMFILPDIKNIKNPIFSVVFSDEPEKEKDWFLYMTPTLNRAVIEAVKTYTRS